MSNAKQREECAFNSRFSRFKIHAFYKNRKPVTHHGQERYHCTVSQINHGHIKQVILNRQKGFDDCLARIDIFFKYYGKPETLMMYDKRRQTIMPDGKILDGKEIRKYIGNNLVEWEEIIIPEEEKIIIADVVSKGNSWVLKQLKQPPPPNIDFKTEVQNAINKPPTTNL